MSDTKDRERARRRAAVVFAVRSGQITAKEGARQLGVSRKTYYEWEARALAAMTEAMEDRATGRPGEPEDEEKSRLMGQIAELQNQLFVAQKTAEVRDMLHAYELRVAGACKSPGGRPEKKQRQKKER